MSSARSASSRCAALLLAGLAWSAPAAADDADELFRRGRALLEAGQIDAACDKLEQSQKLDPAIGTLGLLAYCHERQGKTATAFAEYTAAAEQARKAGQSERERVATERAQALEKTLSKLQLDVRVPAPGLTVTRGAVVLPQAQWGKQVAVDPGSYEIHARAPGRAAWSTRVEVPNGPALIAVVVPELARVAPETATERSRLTDNAVPLAITGVGVVGLGVGSYFGLRAKSKNDDSMDFCDSDNRCSPRGLELRDDAKSAATVSNVGFAVGIVGVATGVVLLLTRGHAAPAAGALSAQVSGHGAGATLSGRF